MMATVTVDGKEYDLETLSVDAKAQLEMLLACDRKLAELQAESAILQTAKNAYMGALKGLLPQDLAN